jgi:hypothetical protein
MQGVKEGKEKKKLFHGKVTRLKRYGAGKVSSYRLLVIGYPC